MARQHQQQDDRKGFVTGHDFSRADKAQERIGL